MIGIKLSRPDRADLVTRVRESGRLRRFNQIPGAVGRFTQVCTINRGGSL